MNRTGIFLAAAGILGVIALIVGVPRFADQHPTQPVVDTPQPPISRPQAVGTGSLTMISRLSHPFVAMGRQDVFATVDLKGMDVPGARSAVNLALVIDRSGSMSGFKLNQAKQAARQLISQLNPSDRLAIVHYGSDVKSMDGVYATTENKERLLAYVDGIWDDGGTNIAAGLSAGRDVLFSSKSDFKVNRMILISDGQPTEGMVETPQLTSLAASIRRQGVSLSSIGVGDDFNENLMEAFAEVGAGAYAYLADAAQLGAIFQKDLNAAGTQVARGVTVTFRVPEGAKLERVLGYSQVSRRFDGNAELVSIALPDFSASQQERLVAHFTLDASRAGESVDVSDIELSYDDVVAGKPVQTASRLSAMTTDKPQVVLDNRDKDAIVFAARARAADNTQRAGEYLENGDREGAQRELQKNQILFDEAKGVAGAEALSEDYANQKVMSTSVSDKAAAPSALKKSLRNQARKDFGLMGSTY